jgi:hypothetical protein
VQIPWACLLLLIASAASAVTTVVPNAYASVEGEINNSYPFGVDRGMRYQQVFGASQFSAMSIAQIALRNDSSFGEPFTATIPSIQIWLSSSATSPDALSATFAGNIGPDNTLVYDGSLTISSTDAAGPGNTRMFDVIINLMTPFYYDPSLGNLLLDVRTTPRPDSRYYFDATGVADDSVSRVWNLNSTETVGTRDSIGLIAQFDAVPEPSSFVLASLGVGLIAWRRRHHFCYRSTGLLGLAGWRRGRD